MKKLRYACLLTGADPAEVASGSRSTRLAVSCAAAAFHVIMLIWGVTGFAISHTLYELDLGPSLAIAAGAALMALCIERLVWGMPRSPAVTAGRIGLGLLVASICALMLDLCLFQPEVREQLRVEARQAEVQRIEGERADQAREVLRLQEEAREARRQADCEMAGTCGTRTGGRGRVWQQLDRQANAAEAAHRAAVQKAEALADQKSAALQGEGPPVDQRLRDSGLLARVDALHRYAAAHPAAAVAWAGVFLLLCCCEFLVVAVKLAFGKPLDERLAEMREQLALSEATDYLAARRGFSLHSRLG